MALKIFRTNELHPYFNKIHMFIMLRLFTTIYYIKHDIILTLAINLKDVTIIAKNAQQNYQDYSFARGHWWLKLRQTLLGLLGWLVLIIPIVITSSTYLAYRSHGHRGFYFWHYREGFLELDFLIIFLTFMLGISAVFCLTIAYVQKQRLEGLLEKWPLFDLTQNHNKRKAAEKFMTARFGDKQQRQNTKYYVVTADQNLSKNQLKKIVNEGADNGF